MKAIILAGGMGTRLKPRVTDLPKTLAPINGRPFLAILLDQFVVHKFTQVIVSIGYLGEKIRTCIGRSYQGMEISYVEETSPLGTGGALAFAFAQLDAGDYVVLNGDTFLQLDYQALYASHLDSGSVITMTLRQVEDTARYGRIDVKNDRVTAFQEKGRSGKGLINAGVYLMNSKLFEGNDLADQFSLETDFLSPNLNQLNPNAYITDGYFIDIGIPEDFDRAQIELG